MSDTTRLREDLDLAAKTLRRYQELHIAKGTPESMGKASANAALAQRFEATLAATELAPPTDTQRLEWMFLNCQETSAEDLVFESPGAWRAWVDAKMQEHTT